MTNDLIKFADGCAFLSISKVASERHVREAARDLPRPFKIGARRWYPRRNLKAYLDAKAAAARRPDFQGQPAWPCVSTPRVSTD